MSSLRELEVAKRMVETTANVLGMGFYTVCGKPVRDLKIADNLCASAFGNSFNAPAPTRSARGRKMVAIAFPSHF